MTKHTLKKSKQVNTKDEVKQLEQGGSLASPHKTLSMSMPNIAKFSLNKKRKNIEISTTTLSRGEMFDRLLTSVTASIYKLVRERVSLDDDQLQTALESKAVLNLVKRHMRDENIQMVDEKQQPRYRRALSMISEDKSPALAGTDDFGLSRDKNHDPLNLKMRVTD